MKKQNLLLALGILLIVIPNVYGAASFSVTAFSCSPDEVKINDQFTCTATVQNSGDAAGTLNTATLYPDSSNWLESSSYATTVNSNINSGASADVTFSSIVGTKSGNNGFARIMLDEVTDTYVADNSITVNNINVAVTASSASSAAKSANVDVTGQATAGGNVDITLTFSVNSGGCGIGNQDASSTTNSMTEGQTTSATWAVTMGTANCVYTIDAAATSNPSGTATKSDSDSVTISCNNCGSSGSSGGTDGSSSSGGGGGGGGGSGEDTTTKTKVWDTVVANGKVTMEISSSDIAISSITISTINPLTNFQVTAKTHGSKKPAAASAFDGTAYQFLEITKLNAYDADISEVKIAFSVKKSWLKENYLEASSIVLFRNAADGWAKLSTTNTGENTDNYLYESTTPGLSFFAIGVEKEVYEAAKAAAEEKRIQEEKEAAKKSEEQESGSIATDVIDTLSGKKGTLAQTLGILVIAALIVIIVVLLVKRFQGMSSSGRR